MFGTRWRLFRLLGIPISVDASWLIIFALLAWSLAHEFPAIANFFYREDVPDLSWTSRWIMGIVTALVFFSCIVLHELGHAVVARATGIPIRGITLFLFGGVAELEGEPKSARDEFWMAIAGPLVSLALAAAFAFTAWAGGTAGWPAEVVVSLGYLAIINTLVLVFNLIPAFPLDGGRVFRSALWGLLGNLRRATYWASLLGQAFAWFLIGMGIFRFFTGDFIGGLWMGLIGMFLNNAAQGTYQQLLMRQALRGEPVRRFMTTNPVVVPPALDLQHWVDDYVYRYHRKTFPVASNGRVEGFIGTEALAQYPRDEWGRHTVAEAMEHDTGEVTIFPETDALDALAKMQRTGSSRLLVTEAGRLVGIVSLKDLLGFLQLKLELEGVEP